MSISDPQHDRWLNERLRDVRLPAGLLLRLRQIASGDDEQLDRALCDVPLPEGLLARLKGIPATGDERLDERLRDVPLPVGLVGQLKGIAIASDEDLDEAVRDVPIPDELVAELKKIGPVLRWAQPRRRMRRVADMVLTASLLLMIGGSYLGAMASLMMDTLSGNRRPVVAVRSPHVKAEIVREDFAVDLSPRSVTPGRPKQLFGTPEMRTELAWQFDGILPPGPQGAAFSLPVGFSLEDINTNYMLYRWGGSLFASPRELDMIGPIRTVSAIVPRGSEPPAIGQFDWKFYRKHRVLPFVSPAAEPSLRTSTVPLGADTHSYDLVQRRLAAGKLPDVEDVRVEDFAAAIDYHFAPPRRDAVGIRTAAGPSPLSAHTGTHLIQVGVQAAEMPSDMRPGAHLTVALDVSASMGWQGRWAMTQQALRGLIRRLGPHDRLSIVTFSDKAERLIENLTAKDSDEILAAIDTLKPGNSTNVGAGLASACLLAMEGAPGRDSSRRVVLLTDGLPRLSNSASARIKQIVSDAHSDGITLEVIDLSGDLKPDEQLNQLARDGGGAVHPATTANQVRWALLEGLTGRSEVVASKVHLKVRFFPEAVAMYRLIGHEPGIKTGSLEVDLRAGQSTTGLFEVVLRPNQVNRVAEAELTWLDPRDGRLHRRTQPISRLQFAATYREAPLSLQAATLVAATAEILRGSKHVQGKTLDDVLQFIHTEQISPKVLNWPSFRRFQTLAEAAQRLGGL